MSSFQHGLSCAGWPHLRPTSNSHQNKPDNTQIATSVEEVTNRMALTNFDALFCFSRTDFSGSTIVTPLAGLGLETGFGLGAGALLTGWIGGRSTPTGGGEVGLFTEA